MIHKFTLSYRLCFGLLACSQIQHLAAEDSAPELALFTDTFDSSKSLEHYDTISPASEAWTVSEGVLVAKQTESHHGCVIRKNIDFNEITMKIRFRFQGGKRFNFVFDDQNEKSVHAAHICRVSVTPKSLKISDDKSGAMNHEIRNRKKADALTKEDLQRLEQSQTTKKISLKKTQWYNLKVTIQGDEMTAYIDEKLIAQHKSPGFAHPTKTKLGMTVTGSTIEFDNFEVFSKP